MKNHSINCLKTNDNNNSKENNILTEIVDNQGERWNQAEINLNQDANNPQYVAITLQSTKASQLLQEISIFGKQSI